MDLDKVPAEEQNTDEMDLDKVPAEEQNTDEAYSGLREDGTDDEETIAEEEALEEEISPEEELMILSQDMNMSLEELLSQTRQTRRTRGKRSAPAEVTPHLTSIEPAVVDNDTEEWQHSELARFYITKVARKDEHESEEDDGEYVPLGAVRRDVRVGEEYQVDLAKLLSSTESSGDKLLWKPTPDLSNDILLEYLKSANKIMTASKRENNESQISTCDQDNVLALEILMQCKYEVKESLNQLKALTTELEAKENTDMTTCKTSDDGMCLSYSTQTKETQ